MNCEDVPMSEWDKLTGAEEEALAEQFAIERIKSAAAIMLDMDMNGSGLA